MPVIVNFLSKEHRDRGKELVNSHVDVVEGLTTKKINEVVASSSPFGFLVSDLRRSFGDAAQLFSTKMLCRAR